MTISEILFAIKATTDPQDLATLAAAIRNQQRRTIRRTVTVGGRAKFTTRGGKTWTGTVERINRKTATLVNCVDDFGQDNYRGFRVPFAMLETI